MTRCLIFAPVAVIVFLAGCGERSAAKNPVAQRESPMHQNDETRPASTGHHVPMVGGRSADYFPLASSSRWEYDVEIQGPGGTSKSSRPSRA